jgi:hypothetical protein
MFGRKNGLPVTVSDVTPGGGSGGGTRGTYLTNAGAETVTHLVVNTAGLSRLAYTVAQPNGAIVVHVDTVVKVIATVNGVAGVVLDSRVWPATPTVPFYFAFAGPVVAEDISLQFVFPAGQLEFADIRAALFASIL